MKFNGLRPERSQWLRVNHIYRVYLMNELRFKSEHPQTSASLRKLSVGDLAVYPAHGVGRINAVESKEVNGEQHEFYIMKIIENDMLIMIPTCNVESVGLREIIAPGNVSKVYDIIRRPLDLAADTQTWNRRYRDYMEKLKTGSLYDVAEVFRDLFMLKNTKDLSFGERKLYDTAQTLLVIEISIAKKTTQDSILAEIEALFDGLA